MPELPEVETLCRQLKEVIAGKKVLATRILDVKLGALENMAGHTMLMPYRIGKGLNLPLNNGQTLRLHLRMTGRLLWQREPAELKHVRWTMTFKHGLLYLIDPRRFATLTLQDDPPVPTGAYDPLGKFSPLLLRESAKSRKMPVKSFLLDQRVIAGIGNIYACEILYKTSISPWRAANSISLPEWKKIGGAAKVILSKAIGCRGTSISDWRDLYGQPGEYQYHLQAYGREGEPCHHCGAKMARLKLAGRGTYYCHVCQQ
ncbi:MAG: bifunctional DNA-formamidopyrimidine glycosylase/DNA-(apurinic or apyrimidinic site) lyase [Syntrophales bacterium]